MNNGKTGANPYEAKVYGDDIGNYDRTKRAMNPVLFICRVFGISRQNSAVFAIIENGEETATPGTRWCLACGRENNNAYVSFAPVAERMLPVRENRRVRPSSFPGFGMRMRT